jgi:hypothetical protein
MLRDLFLGGQAGLEQSPGGGSVPTSCRRTS